MLPYVLEALALTGTGEDAEALVVGEDRVTDTEANPAVIARTTNAIDAKPFLISHPIDLFGSGTALVP